VRGRFSFGVAKTVHNRLALLDGGAARIAGELSFDEFDGALAWVLNANSGRYCRSAPPSKAQIDNVADRLRRKGLTVRVDYFDAQDAM
jgi:hypothetical protein